MPRLYAAVVERRRRRTLLFEHETGHAEALVGDHLSVTNERVKFQRRLTNGEIARLGLKPGESEEEVIAILRDHAPGEIPFFQEMFAWERSRNRPH